MGNVPLEYATPIVKPSKAMLWTGRVISTLVSLFLLMDGVMKLLKPQVVVQGTMKYGFSEHVITPLGIVLICCTLLYILPPTAVLGAVLLTGYLGGACCTHVRASDPMFNVFFPVIFGMLAWLGLVLRDRRLAALLPLRTSW